MAASLSRSLLVAVTAAAILPLKPLYAQPGNDPRAEAVVARSLARMGGDSLLNAVTSVRMDVMTQWQRIGFSDLPYADAPSYERHTELRNYTTKSWRNTRYFLPSPSIAVDVVRDTVGARWLSQPNGPRSITPLNIAYVDERRELFAFAPERTLQQARASGTLRLLTDTTLGGVPHARVRGTVDGFPATWFLHRSTHLLSMIRFSADETNDFGLAPWARQDVEIWYSGWTRYNPGVLIARQRDVRRVGRPYKRMTAMVVAVNAPAPADSFAIPDSAVTRYLATERRPMWQVSLDSVQIVENAFANFPPFIGSIGAVRIGGQWVLLETAQTEGAVDIVHNWLAKQTGAGASVAIVARPVSGNGGVRWFAAKQRPLYVAPGAATSVRRMTGAANAARATVVSKTQWVRIGSDSVLITPFEVPDFGVALAVYSPTLRWLYTPFVGVPTYQVEHDVIMADLKRRQLPVEWMGTTRALRTAAPRPTN
ncbi:MAG TPA: hypothetical protein DGD08_11085 [Gemmatimonas aurantiaca]|uniref:Uncharacterized protein n=3 Tax=Gemmatimonas aurantiaca TaxID=173480 RepID=C1ACN0_GEMAT|nr:hypothetical protein GAU_3215 [Gemmatimonas aurantiaca T-27]HCT57733.1 hypothetical protein [Gemmatimonas aurantiaca]